MMAHYFEKISSLLIILIFFSLRISDMSKDCNFKVISTVHSEITKESKKREWIPISLNKARVHDLEQIPGIGRKLAERIVNHRIKNGDFKKISELQNVKGIKEKKFDKIKQYLTI